jgi:hypothetical protein
MVMVRSTAVVNKLELKGKEQGMADVDCPRGAHYHNVLSTH